MTESRCARCGHDRQPWHGPFGPFGTDTSCASRVPPTGGLLQSYCDCPAFVSLMEEKPSRTEGAP